MSENIRVENWCGYDIRFVEHEGNWYAVLKDICDALGLRTNNTKLRIDELHLVKLAIESVDKMPETYQKAEDCGVVNSFSEYTQVRHMLCVDEAGIYQALSRSTRLEARKFIDWISHSLVDLRKAIGLEGYEALRLTESTIQEAISKKIDIPYVEPTGDIIPVEVTPTIIEQHIHQHNHYNTDYRKIFGYAAVGCVCGIVVFYGARYVYKKVKAKKAEKEAKEVAAE